MRTLGMLVLIVIALMAANGFRTEAQEKNDLELEARVAHLEERLAELETGVIFPGEDVRYESVGVTEAKGLFLGKTASASPASSLPWKMPWRQRSRGPGRCATGAS